jgi:hypothetical protein
MRDSSTALTSECSPTLAPVACRVLPLLIAAVAEQVRHHQSCRTTKRSTLQTYASFCSTASAAAVRKKAKQHQHKKPSFSRCTGFGPGFDTNIRLHWARVLLIETKFRLLPATGYAN